MRYKISYFDHAMPLSRLTQFARKSFYKIFLFVVLLSSFYEPLQAASIKKNKKGTLMKSSLIYISPFADYQRTSFINTTTSAKGKITWSFETGVTATKHWTTNVALWGGDPLILTLDNLILLDLNGKKLWSSAKKLRTAMGIYQGRLYTQSKSGFLQIHNLDGTLQAKDLPFPGGLGEKSQTGILVPREKDFVSVVFDSDQHDHAEDGEQVYSKPHATIIQNRYEITYGDWSQEEACTWGHSTPLFDSKRDILSLWTDTHFIRGKMTGSNTITKFNPQIPGAIDWSMDDSEQYYVIASESNLMQFASFDASGKIKWQWKQEIKTDKKSEVKSGDTAALRSEEKWLPHPPAIGANGRLYVLTNQKIRAFDQKDLVWSYSLKSSSTEMSFVTVLSDNSILVANEKDLVFLDETGKKIWNMTFDEEILSSPVVDENGNIFIATVTKVFRIN